ncbi:hypothetical protein D9M72_531040 [compost metagenome]
MKLAILFFASSTVHVRHGPGRATRARPERRHVVGDRGRPANGKTRSGTCRERQAFNWAGVLSLARGGPDQRPGGPWNLDVKKCSWECSFFCQLGEALRILISLAGLTSAIAFRGVLLRWATPGQVHLVRVMSNRQRFRWMGGGLNTTLSLRDIAFAMNKVLR